MQEKWFSMDAKIGTIVALALALVETLHIREPALRWGLFFVTLTLISEAVVRSDWASRPEARRPRIWRRSVGIILIVAVFFPVGLYIAAPDLPVDDPKRALVRSYGSDSHLPSPHFFLVAHGTNLLPYQQKYKLAVVCMQWTGTSAPEDARGLQKSDLYDVKDTSSLVIVVPWDDDFRQRVVASGGNTSYILLAVPNGIGMGQFNTLHEAYRLGVKQIWARSGPP